MTILYLSILVGAAFGLATARRSRSHALAAVRSPVLLLLALSLQVPFIYSPPVAPGDGLDPLRLTLPAGLLLTASFLACNRHLPGARLALLGVAANAAVVLANGGLMPTNARALEAAGMETRAATSSDPHGTRLLRSKDVLLRPEETHLLWLSDVFVSPPMPRRTVMSVGDLFLAAGLATLAAAAMRRSMARHAVTARAPGGAGARVEGIALALDVAPTRALVPASPAARITVTASWNEIVSPDRPSPELCRLFNSALFAPELRAELLPRPAGAAARWAAAAPGTEALHGPWPPPLTPRAERIDLTPNDRVLLRGLPPVCSIAELWQRAGAATGAGAPAYPPAGRSRLPGATEALEMAAVPGQRAS